MDLVTIFYHTDEFCKSFEKAEKKSFLSDGKSQRYRAMRITLSEVMTIMIYYHYSGYKTLKDYYLKGESMLRSAFPSLVSYTRFIELKAKALIPLALFVRLCGLGACTGITFMDSFSLKACHIKRENSHKVLKHIAKKGKTTVGWFYGLKVHLALNHKGEIIDFYVTSGNSADNNSTTIKRMSKKLFGKIYADKGYILNSDLTELLLKKDIQFITKAKKTMKKRMMLLQDRLLLSKRAVIESAISLLKQEFSIEQTRHRSCSAFFVHLCSVLMAYAFRLKKPSLSANSTILTSFA